MHLFINPVHCVNQFTSKTKTLAVPLILNKLLWFGIITSPTAELVFCLLNIILIFCSFLQCFDPLEEVFTYLLLVF